MVVIRRWGMRVLFFNVYRVSALQDEKILEICFTSMWIYLTLFDCIKNWQGGKFYTFFFFLPQFKKEKQGRLNLSISIFPSWYYRPSWFINFMERNCKAETKYYRQATHMHLNVLLHVFITEWVICVFILIFIHFSKQSSIDGLPNGKFSKAFIVSLTASF